MNSDSKLRVVRVVDGTSVDGPGLRTSIYFAGCAHCCPGCHNMQTWPFDSGELVTVHSLMERIRYNGGGVTLSGGDPIYQAAAILPLAKAIKSEGLSLWCYTGFIFEDIINNPELSDAAKLLDYIDVLVDGPFIQSQRDTNLLFRGSANQRLIDVRATRKGGRIIEWSRD